MSGRLCRVILYGDSLVLHGVRFSLEARPEFEIVSLHPGHVSLQREITTKSPVALIFDASTMGTDFPSSLLQQPDLLLISIDPETHQALIWSGRRAAAVEAADLLGFIRQKHSEFAGEASLKHRGRTKAE